MLLEMQNLEQEVAEFDRGVWSSFGKVRQDDIEILLERR